MKIQVTASSEVMIYTKNSSDWKSWSIINQNALYENFVFQTFSANVYDTKILFSRIFLVRKKNF